MIVNFIRHGKTSGNLKRSYIGSTDEILCETGIEEVKAKNYPLCDVLAVSPMKRCIQTAEIIYGNSDYIVCEDFRECDFGLFEGKTYEELKDNPEYIKWCESPFGTVLPEGENPDEFRKRCVREFVRLTNSIENTKTLSIVVHGGTIMSVMEAFEENHRSFYEYHIENACVFVTEFDGNSIRIADKI